MNARRRPSKTIHNDVGTPSHDNQRQCKAAPFHQLHQVLRTLVFFCDGMSWSYILPGGPTFLFRWFQPGSRSNNSSIITSSGSATFPPESSWSSWKTDWYAIYHYLESVIAVYVLGRCLGKVLCKRLPFLHSRATYSTQVTRVVTATLFVHVFAAGLLPEKLTIVLRLITAILAGMLCGMTSIASLGEVIVHAIWNVSTATKTYWMGFTTCVLLTSFIRAHQSIFITPMAVGGVAVVAKLILSPLFLTGLAEGAEIILRFLFAFTPEHHSNTTSIPKQISTRSPPIMQRNAIKRSTSAVSRQSDTKRPREIQPTSPPQLRQSSSSQEPKADSNNSSTNSSFSSLESSERVAAPTSYETELCVYRDRKCVYADGSPAYVPQGDCTNQVPANFMEFYNYDRARARQAWEATQEWRRSNNVWRIHTLPNRWFPRIKQAYPHFVHGHSKDGYPIIYEQPGRMRLKELFRSGAWSGLKGILPDTVQVDILSESKYLNALREFIDDDQIPPEYGGTSPYRLGQHPYEMSLRQLVEERLQEESS
eukprot:scaffold2120_cov169-Amphora_coffeaeformis.AAC.16